MHIDMSLDTRPAPAAFGQAPVAVLAHTYMTLVAGRRSVPSRDYRAWRRVTVDVLAEMRRAVGLPRLH